MRRDKQVGSVEVGSKTHSAMHAGTYGRERMCISDMGIDLDTSIIESSRTMIAPMILVLHSREMSVQAASPVTSYPERGILGDVSIVWGALQTYGRFSTE